MWPDSLLGINVSRETIEKLELYHALLLKWQKAINLVSNKTLGEAWVRHFADSAQLEPYLGDVTKIADIGSGAGFPGLVLAILRPDISVHMIESDERKCQFLKNVSRETSLENVTIHTDRAENILPTLNAEMVSARALADLSKLFEFCLPLAQKDPKFQMLFLKGENWQAEVSGAQEHYEFSITDYPSVSDPKARILKISELKILSSRTLKQRP